MEEAGRESPRKGSMQGHRVVMHSPVGQHWVMATWQLPEMATCVQAEVVWRTAQVMRNVAAMLGPGWGMQVFHGDRNCALLKAHFSEEERGGRVAG